MKCSGVCEAVWIRLRSERPTVTSNLWYKIKHVLSMVQNQTCIFQRVVVDMRPAAALYYSQASTISGSSTRRRLGGSLSQCLWLKLKVVPYRLPQRFHSTFAASTYKGFRSTIAALFSHEGVVVKVRVPVFATHGWCRLLRPRSGIRDPRL